MIQANFNWNGDRVYKLILEAGWDGIRRATLFYWQRLEQVLNVANTGVSKKLPWGGSQRVYLNPSKAGEAPHKVTGFGQHAVGYEFDQPNLASRVGIGRNAKYLAMHEFGTRPHTIAMTNKMLLFWSKLFDKWMLKRSVHHPGTKPRPWMMPTLAKYFDQIAQMAGGG